MEEEKISILHKDLSELLQMGGHTPPFYTWAVAVLSSLVIVLFSIGIYKISTLSDSYHENNLKLVRIDEQLTNLNEYIKTEVIGNSVKIEKLKTDLQKNEMNDATHSH